MAEAGKTVAALRRVFRIWKVFDFFIQERKPIEFKLGQGQVIEGWDEGIALLKVGDKARL
jgi:peptidyl-prolyl cis-trans isomerase A (cyclophilin A)